MKIGTIIQLALLFMKLANWFTQRVDRAEWEASGYKKAMEDERDAINASVGFADKTFIDAEKLTPEEKRKRLGEDI